MSKLSILIDDIVNNELRNYLLTLNGVYNCNILDNTIVIEYDSNANCEAFLKKEVYLFLSIKMPIMLAFDKHSKLKLKHYNLVLKDLCCEYCLKATIEELFDVEGIDCISTNFDFINKKDVNVKLTYDDSIIPEIKIKELEQKYNHKEEQN